MDEFQVRTVNVEWIREQQETDYLRRVQGRTDGPSETGF